ncbi:MAG: hypothetical protein ACK5IP_15875 [Paracoccus sp. (in: a-proteobacteria)]
MNGKRSTGEGRDSREARLRAALRANLARRKAQARARTDARTDAGNNKAEPDEQETGRPEGDE